VRNFLFINKNMINILKLLLKEIKIFSINNWWVYLIFIFCIVIIYITSSGNLIEIFWIFFLHFLADIFVMMMLYYFSIKDNIKWTIFQELQILFFTIIWIIWVFASWKYHYLLVQFAFWLSPIKNFFLNFKNKKLNFINYKLGIFINILLFIVLYFINTFTSISIFIQFLWFAFFSVGLILDDYKKQYYINFIWMFLIAFWSFLSLYFSFLVKDISWLDVSYFILPLTVLVFYIKNYKKIWI